MKKIIIKSDSINGPYWIGGSPPDGVIPQISSNTQKYFGTFPFIIGDGELSVSIFYSLDPNFSGKQFTRFDVIRNNNIIISQGELLSAIIHKNGTVGRIQYSTDVSFHSITILNEESDECRDEEGVYPFEGSKVGGNPYSFKGPQLDELFCSLINDGYSQVIQITTPHPINQDYITGYPWDPGYLHVFYREMDGSPSFKFIIQQ